LDKDIPSLHIFLVQVYLTDENDNKPAFLPFPHEYNITEDTPVGTIIFSTPAIDLDRDDKLTYWITGSKGLLGIDSR